MSMNPTTLPTALPTGTWQLDPSATTVTVSVKKLGLFTVPATLAVSSGTIQIDGDDQVVDVEVAADASSYASKNAKRNEHVVGDDFLDAGTHPTITFRAGGLTATGDGYRADGTVTIKGKTSPITVTIDDVEFSEDTGSFTASGTVDRTAIGIDKMPTFLVGRTLALAVSAKATRTT